VVGTVTGRLGSGNPGDWLLLPEDPWLGGALLEGSPPPAAEDPSEPIVAEDVPLAEELGLGAVDPDGFAVPGALGTPG
jgi:hypothetical protein